MNNVVLQNLKNMDTIVYFRDLIHLCAMPSILSEDAIEQVLKAFEEKEINHQTTTDEEKEAYGKIVDGIRMLSKIKD